MAEFGFSSNFEPAMHKSWSIAVAEWLGALIFERYALPMTLKCQGDHWCLSIPGADNIVLIDVDSGMFTRADSDLPYCTWDAGQEGWVSVLGNPLPMPGMLSIHVPLIERTVNGYSIHYDILGLAYWMLTRQEEIGRTDLDEHGRFPSTASHAHKHGYLERPIVDEWLNILGQVIMRTWSTAVPRSHQFKIKVSHDVDSASRYGFRPWRRLPFGIANDVLRNHDARGFLAPWIRVRTRTCLHPLDGFNTFDWLMDVSERHDLQSAFYFICEQRDALYDCDYDIGHPAIQHVLRKIHRRGHEIGLHPSYDSFLDPERIDHEAKRLRATCAGLEIDQHAWGGRMHWLQWSHPLTLRAWANAGMAYDSTMTYAECPGFRCGTCFEYPAFDPVAQEVLPIRVRPLVVMEGSVLAAYGLGLGVGAKAREKMLGLKDVCRRVGGCFTLLWHNSSFPTPSCRDLYLEILNG